MMKCDQDKTKCDKDNDEECVKRMRLKGSQGEERESVIYNQRTGRGNMGERGEQVEEIKLEQF